METTRTVLLTTVPDVILDNCSSALSPRQLLHALLYLQRPCSRESLSVFVPDATLPRPSMDSYLLRLTSGDLHGRVICVYEYPTPHRHIDQLSLVIPANAGIQVP